MVLSIALAFIAQQGTTERIWYPQDAGVINVTQAPYFAFPDDRKDDTLAIQQALIDHPTGNHVFYFPKGIYEISDCLMKLPKGNPLHNRVACLELRGTQKRNILVGESEEETILRLSDAVPSSFDKAMFWFGPKPAQRFRNAIRQLTVSIGKDHPRATAVMFNASNQGGLRQVTIKSEDAQLRGAVGLDLAHTDEIGPLLVQQVTIRGFDRGIRCAFQTASQTFEHVTLLDQLVYGMTVGFSQSVFMRKLKFQGSVTAVRNGPTVRGDPGQGRLLLLDADLRNSGPDLQLRAIRNQKAAYFRNIQATGFSRTISQELDHGRGNPSVDFAVVDEFIANGSGERRRGEPFSLFENSAKSSLDLVVKKPPVVAWEQDPSNWTSPHHFPIKLSGKPDDPHDDTPSLQAAIDSGATTIYLPRGTWRIRGTLYLREYVKHFLGCEARLNPLTRGEVATVTLSPGETSCVLVEGLEAGGVQFTHQSDRTLHLRHILGCTYQATRKSPGDLFLTDVVSGPVSIGKDQRLWARQLDIETDTTKQTRSPAKIHNQGGTAWILGLKTEDAGTVIRTERQGKTELLGHIHVGATGDAPCFVTVDSQFSAALSHAPRFPVAAVEIRGSQKRQAGDFNFADLYTAWGN